MKQPGFQWKVKPDVSFFFFRGSLVESPGVAKSYLGSQDDGMTGDFSFRFFSVSRGVNNPPWVFIASFFLAQFRKTWEE